MTAADRLTLTNHLGFMQRMTANSKRSHGWTFDEEIAALERALDHDEKLQAALTRCAFPNYAGGERSGLLEILLERQGIARAALESETSIQEHRRQIGDPRL